MSVLPLLLVLTPQTAGTIEVPFRDTDDAIIVDAKVNGRPVSLMFDTGFGGTVLLSSSVDVGAPTGKMTLRDFVGELEVNTVKLKSLAVGTKNVPLNPDMEIVQQPGDMSASYGTHVDGILGLSALKGGVFTIDFEHNKFVFRPDAYDITKQTPDNKKTFLQKLLPIGKSSLEMFVSAPNGKTMTLALDTGNAFYATTHRDVLERVGLWDANKPHKFAKLSGVASGAVESWSFKMPELNIFGVPTPPSIWDIIDLPSSSAEGDGTVGHGFLRNFNITVDYPRRRVWLENFRQPIANEEEGDVGLSAGFDPNIKRTVVIRVTPDSPAADAGIKEGDHVLMVDGEDLDRVGYVRFRKLMEGKVGSSVRIAVSHNGALKRLELKRVALINGA